MDDPPSPSTSKYQLSKILMDLIYKYILNKKKLFHNPIRCLFFVRKSLLGCRITTEKGSKQEMQFLKRIEIQYVK